MWLSSCEGLVDLVEGEWSRSALPRLSQPSSAPRAEKDGGGLRAGMGTGGVAQRQHSGTSEDQRDSSEVLLR